MNYFGNRKNIITIKLDHLFCQISAIKFQKEEMQLFTKFAELWRKKEKKIFFKLLERLKKNPELLEALDKMKPVKNTPQLIMDESNEIARRIEKQFFEIIPGIPGLTTYRNLFLCEMAKDDIKSVEVTDV